MDIQQREKIEDKITRLKEFCENNLKLWYISDNQKKLDEYMSEIDDETTKQKLMDELNTAQKDYDYIRERMSRRKKLGTRNN